MAAPGVETKTVPMKKGIVKQVSRIQSRKLAFFGYSIVMELGAKLAEYEISKI